MSIAENLASGLLDRVRQRWGSLMAGTSGRSPTTRSRCRVRRASTGQALRQLSGGNQQKVVFGKWMGLSPKVAILDEPTRGVDVGARDEIHELIEGLAREGMGILVISSEMEELVRLCDRILSMYEGRIVAALSGAEITPDAVTQSYLNPASVTATGLAA